MLDFGERLPEVAKDQGWGERRFSAFPWFPHSLPIPYPGLLRGIPSHTGDMSYYGCREPAVSTRTQRQKQVRKTVREGGERKEGNR